MDPIVCENAAIRDIKLLHNFSFRKNSLCFNNFNKRNYCEEKLSKKTRILDKRIYLSLHI